MKKLSDLSISSSILLAILLITGIGLLTSSFINYNIFFDTTNQVVETTSREINKQIILNYENYIDDVIDIANFIQKETVELSKSNDIAGLNDTYLFATNIEQSIVSISLFSTNGGVVVSSRTNEIFSSSVYLKSWFTDAISDANIFHFSSPHIQDVYQNGNEEVITITKVIEYYSDGTSKDGVLTIELEMSNFYELSTQTNLGEGGHIIILDEEYFLVYSSIETCMTSTCESLDITNQIILGGAFVEVNGIDMYANVNTLAYTRWRIATFINVESVNDAKNSVLVSLAFAFMLTFLITFTVSTLISLRISLPIKKLKDHISLLQKGDFNTKVKVKGQKEVVILADAFNLMTDEIKILMLEVLKEQKAKRKTQFAALQNQINPHFLYNTLDSIVWLSENNRNEDLEKMVIALSKFFRISITNETNRISLAEEVEHAKNYLLIQQIRYHNRFSFELDIDETLLENKVLKLSIQPLVENAIYHGISHEDDYAKIFISAFVEEGYLKISVRNDGYGISDAKIKEIYETFTNQRLTKSIGLKNVYQRLKLFYGEYADLKIESVLDEYTTVTMSFPIKEEEMI